MTPKDKRLVDFLNVARTVGEKVLLPEEDRFDVTVVSNESFAVEVIKEVSTMKYLYELDGPMLYCTHKKIIPQKYDDCKAIVDKALRELWG